MSTDVATRPAVEADLEAINRIYNDEIRHGVATWDLEPWTLDQRVAWFRARDASQPVLVAEVDGEFAGFGYLSLYRPKAGYRYTREDTVYLDPRFQGRGVGRALLGALIAEARRLGIHALLGVIEASNAASIALHERLGFEVVGRRREVGRKFDRWLSTVEVELVLD